MIVHNPQNSVGQNCCLVFVLTFKTIFVSTQDILNLYFSCNSMNNLSSYCGLTDSRIGASDTDLPVTVEQIRI